jgi:hypothetical protein
VTGCTSWSGRSTNHPGGIRQTTEPREIAGATITAFDPACDPAFDPDDPTMSAARAVVHEMARGIRSQPTSRTG